MRLPTAALAGLLAAAPALSAEPARIPGVPAAVSAPTVPGDDIFGFTSVTEVGNPGDRYVAVEATQRAGRREGRYGVGTLKAELGFTVAENLAVIVAPFAAWFDIRDSLALADRRSTTFDGLSGEVSWRFLPRTSSGIAATFSLEPRWARVDSISGAPADVLFAELKLLVDAVLIPGTLYAGLNLNYGAGASRLREGEAGPWIAGSATSVSAALAYQLSDQLFVGGEARFLSAFDGGFLNRNLGNALMAGPNALIRLNERAAIAVAWTPQVAGAARPSSGRLDLDNFERHEFRLRATISY